MRILILGSKEYPFGTNKGEDPLPSGGIEIYVQGLISHLSNAKKTEIVIITRKFSKTRSHEKIKNVEILRVTWIKGLFFRNISFNFSAFLRALSVDFNVIHSHTQIATFFGIILARIKKVPIIATPHGLALEQPQYNLVIKRFFSVLEKFTYSKVDYIIFLSEQEKNKFKKKIGFLPKKYRIVYPGVDINKFETADGEKIKKEFNLENKKIISFIGRLIEVKGLRYLIQATSKIKNNFSLLIVGSGQQRRELDALVSRLNLKNIVFTGHRSDIPDILAATDIFVLPSLSEGLPTTLLEAMSSGKACLVTDIGLPVEQKKNALVVRAGDVDDLEKALKELLQNNRLRKRLGESAKKKAKRIFSWEKAVNSHKELLEELSPESDLN
jgi:glycosyltransferase involved in cell wall biosynthesis